MIIAENCFYPGKNEKSPKGFNPAFIEDELAATHKNQNILKSEAGKTNAVILETSEDPPKDPIQFFYAFFWHNWSDDSCINPDDAANYDKGIGI
ncbi:MAG: hypothetical protein HQK54_14235 [Oligoflexales bacterium]|nr:hypothetical protein [Oligoflexales bacterium]